MTSTTSSSPAVVLENVTKRFGAHVAVDDVSLTIPRGSICGFIGPNGAGKTTTLRMVMHILLPDGGRVEVLGRPAGRETAQRVGYLPEERGIYPKMRVFDQLLYLGRLKGRTRSELTPRIDGWLERFGLSTWRDKRCQELSKGMQQKVQFISTIAHDPELVILDEPFSGLDPVNSDLLRRIIDELKRSGRTVIFSTHVMEHAEELCDTVVMICKAKKVLDGTLEEIRGRHREEVLDLAGSGDVALLRAAPGVRTVVLHPGRYEVQLEPGADPQRLLQHLVGRFLITRFEVRAPRLHDLFLRIAGAPDPALVTMGGE